MGARVGFSAGGGAGAMLTLALSKTGALSTEVMSTRIRRGGKRDEGYGPVFCADHFENEGHENVSWSCR